MEKIIIIGSGPSALSSAIYAKNENNEVIILEKNNYCAKKLLLTGAGRCNYFNENFSTKFYNVDNAITKKIIDNKDVYLDFLNKLGLEHTIINGYYYPFSKSSISVQNALILRTNELGIKIKYDVEVKTIEKMGKGYILNNEYYADKVIIGTGSKAYPKTGSTGDFYNILSNLGIKINKVLPALVQLRSDDKLISKWPLLRVSSKIELYIDNKLIKKEEGELQLTNYGVSGICVLTLSHLAVKALDNDKKVNLNINFLPNIEDYEEFINQRLKNLPNRNLVEFFEGIVNYKLLKELFKNKKIDENLCYENLSDDLKNKVKNTLLNFTININGSNSFSESQVCQGGVDLSEITENFEFIKYPNLYAVGELLDVHGDCGGYNLAFAFISGIIAGKKAGEND